MENEDYRYIEDPNARYLMDCGHMNIYQKKFTEEGIVYEVPVCVKCSCYSVETEPVDLTKRIARCNMCGKEVRSDLNLSGFHYLKKKGHDIFYCGCANEKFLEIMNLAQTS